MRKFVQHSSSAVVANWSSPLGFIDLCGFIEMNVTSSDNLGTIPFPPKNLCKMGKRRNK